jgi:hypothetical protein
MSFGRFPFGDRPFGFVSSTYTLTADKGSYTQTGVAATLKQAHLLTAAVGSYSLTGVAASLKVGYKVTAVVGSYTLTGVAAALRRTYTPLTASAGSYSLTGVSASLKVGYKVAASVGSYSLTGIAAALRRTYTPLAAGAGSYSLTGKAANLLVGHAVTAAAGAYTLTGVAAGLRRTYTALAASAGSYSLTGVAAQLTYAPTGAYVLGAAGGSYSLTGVAAGLRVARNPLAAGAGAYSLAGVDAGLLVGTGGLVLPLTLDFVTATWTDGASATGPLSDLVAVAAVDPDYGNTARLAVGNLATLLLGGTPLTWVVDISDVPSGAFAVDAPFIFKTDFSAYVDFYADILGANPGYRLSDQSGGNILGATLSAGPHRFAFNLAAAAAVSSDGGANGVATFAPLTTYDKAVVVGGAVGVVSKIRILELQDAATLPALSALEVAGQFGGGGGTISERRRVEEARRARARARAEQRVKAPKYRQLSHAEIYGRKRQDDEQPERVQLRERHVLVPGGEVHPAEAGPQFQTGALGALGAEQAREAAAAAALLAEVERLKTQALEVARLQAAQEAAFRDDEDAIAAILQAMVL